MNHRHLPHWQKEDHPHFLTWRLHGSLPGRTCADLCTTDGFRFVRNDKLLDAASTGSKWLSEPVIANRVTEVLFEGEAKRYYELGAWVVMPNHIHMIVRPFMALLRVVDAIKRNTAVEATRLLNRTGQHFWARDYFDRWIGNRDEEIRITRSSSSRAERRGS